MCLVEITNDLYDIASRIKEIDGNYRLFLNKSKNRYEVHDERGMQAALPFDELDARTVCYLRETRIERLDAVLSGIERHNCILEKDLDKKREDEIREAADKALKNTAG